MRSHIRNQDIGSEGIFFLIGKNTRVSDSHDIRIDDLKSEIELNGDFAFRCSGGAPRDLAGGVLWHAVLPSPLDDVLVLLAPTPLLDLPRPHHGQRVRELADLCIPKVPPQPGRP